MRKKIYCVAAFTFYISAILGCSSSMDLYEGAKTMYLTVEQRVNPVGIDDVWPEFSWVVEDFQPGQGQQRRILRIRSIRR